MPVRWDAPLVSAVAAELHDALAGARLRSVHLDGDGRVAMLFLRASTLVAELHPERSRIRLLGAQSPFADALPLASRIVGVHAPPDDRLIYLDGHRRKGGAPLRIVIELLGNRMNLLVTEGREGRIRHILRSRSGRTELLPGHPYQPPAPTGRLGMDGSLPLQQWMEVLEASPAEERRRTLTRRIAWTSSLNASALLGSAAWEEGPAAGDALRAGHLLWRAIAGGEPPVPVLLTTERGLQPYPRPLPGLEAEPVPSLLEAFERIDPDRAAAPIDPRLREIAEAEVARARAHLGSLEREADGLEDPGSLRSVGDLLLARLAQVPAGASRVELADFEGGTTRIELDPERSAADNAAAYYDRAGRAERAARKLPLLIEESRRRLASAERLLDAIDHGQLSEEARTRLTRQARSAAAGRSERKAAPTLPYRSFRSSGGLEIRVGRGDKRNDELTFHHSRPDDVWLHARHASGAHVVLRWNGEGSPPPRDLAEAASLAALYSRARTSGVVPVDWTRRKYVRKPRKARPGSVTMERASTVFAEPNEDLAERLRMDTALDPDGQPA